jgi:type I restriction enzyme S subunit
LSYATSSANTNINQESLAQIKVHFPSLPEQQKIASFLTAIDEKIRQLTRRKELLEQYKKGVMQQLFSGKLRFKDEKGKAYPKWEEKKLGDVAIITMGQSPSSKSYNNDSIGKLLIQGNADISGRATNPRQWTSEPTKECKIGDLILTVRAPVGSISKSYHNACIGRGVCSIRNKKNSNFEYLYQFLLDYEDKWKRIEQGSTFTAVSGSDIISLKLNLPSLNEQHKIASFLSSIDTKIESVNAQIEGTKGYKKGLLQKMFV